EVLLQYYSGKKFDDDEKVCEITKLYDKLKIKEDAEALMQEYCDKAMADLEAISVSEERKSVIRDFALMLNVRNL
ncbi:MAG: hypothetical protein Q8908_07700, partial [Bacteroidota bacterium]|nr:hypothetical protein [Bacteroidota bacterium]